MNSLVIYNKRYNNSNTLDSKANEQRSKVYSASKRKYFMECSIDSLEPEAAFGVLVLKILKCLRSHFFN